MVGVKLDIRCEVVAQSTELIAHKIGPGKDQIEFKYFYKTKKIASNVSLWLPMDAI